MSPHSTTVTDIMVTLNLPVIVIVNLEVKPTAGISKIHIFRSRKYIKILAGSSDFVAAEIN